MIIKPIIGVRNRQKKKDQPKPIFLLLPKKLPITKAISKLTPSITTASIKVNYLNFYFKKKSPELGEILPIKFTKNKPNLKAF